MISADEVSDKVFDKVFDKVSDKGHGGARPRPFGLGNSVVARYKGAMPFDWNKLGARGPKAATSETVTIREWPLEELGITFLFIIFGGIWAVFSDDLLDFFVGRPLDSPVLQTMKGVNFVATTALLLYVILRRSFRTRRLANEASRINQERFEAVARATTDAIWDWNLETDHLWWSDGFETLFGYRRADVVPTVEWWIDRLHPDDKNRVVKTLREEIDRAGKAWSAHYRFRRQDGSYAVVLDRGYILKGGDGKATRLVGGLSDITERRRAEEALEQSRRQLRALSARLQSAREDERTSVAREIHDELGQALTALKINLDWIEGKLEERPPDPLLNPLLERVVESGEMTEAAITSVQRIATELRPGLLDNLGLAAALEQEARRFQQRTGIACALDLPPEPFELARPAATAVFRIFQEALTNVARHAQATTASISLRADPDHVVLEVQDNGCGIRPEAVLESRSLGLLGMRERAVVLGGDLAIAPVSPAGTRVTLRLPRAADDAKFWAAL